MSVEYDFLSGIDLSGLTSVTQTQLMQMVAQSSPLTNRGLIIYSATTPDLASNARFARYIWLDSSTVPPVPKIYNSGTATWVNLSIAALSISNSHVAAAAAIEITKLAFGTARYIVRTNAAGNALEFITPNNIFNDNELSLSRLSNAAAPAGTSYLQYNSATGNKTWQAIAFADFASGDVLGVTKIQPSAVNNQILATIAGVSAWAELSTLIGTLTAGSIAIDKLASGTALQVLRRNAGNTANEWAVPIFSLEYAVEDSANIDVNYPDGAATLRNISYSTLGTRAKAFRVVLLCKSADGTTNHNATEEIPLEHVFHIYNSGATDDSAMPAFGYVITASDIRIIAKNCAAGTRQVYNRSTGALSVLTVANWRIKIYTYA